MVWREPKDHSSDCYFCFKNIGGITSKSKHTVKYMMSVKYPDFPSALKTVPHSEELPTLLFIIGIQPLGWFGQRPELSQATGRALVRCILGKFLGVVCHCFPPRLNVPTFATRCLHVCDKK